MVENFIQNLPIMEPILVSEPMDDPDFTYQIKWDGVRMLAGIEPGKMVLINRRKHIRTLQYPELQAIPEYLKASSAVLDGEVIALKQGKPSFPTVMRRDSARIPEAIRYLQRLVPITYIVFDLLFLDGKSLLDEPLSARSLKLQNLLTNTEHIKIIEDFTDGPKLYEATKLHQLEGIVAKRYTSTYHSGKKHQDWFKIKHRQTITCTVGGYTTRNNMINSLLMGILEDDKLIYVGSAASGLTASHLQILTEQLPRLRIEQSPFKNYPSRKGKGYFVHPVLQTQVEFLEWTEQANLRSPVIKGFPKAQASELADKQVYFRQE